MFQFILEVFVKYWLEIIFGLIAAGAGFFAKRYIKLERERIDRERKEHDKEVCEKVVAKLDKKIKEVDDRSNAADKIMEAEIEVVHHSMENLTAGMLSMQGKQFIDFCRTLLQADHIITVDEYEIFTDEYAAYKGLGGNHRGDALADAVKTKFKNTVS